MNHEYYDFTIHCYRCLGKYNKQINCTNVRLLEKQLDDLYHKLVLHLVDKYKKEIVEYLSLTLSKIIDNKRHVKKIIKAINNMSSFEQLWEQYAPLEDL